MYEKEIMVSVLPQTFSLLFIYLNMYVNEDMLSDQVCVPQEIESEVISAN